MLRHLTALTILLGPLAIVSAEDTVEKIEGIGPNGPLTVVHDDFRFTEGPAVNAQGELYFADVFAGRVHKANPGGEVITIIEKSGGINGMMFDRQGRLFGCQGSTGQIVLIDLQTQAMTPVTKGYAGKRFNRPNDLVLDSHGGIYFTDPKFGKASQDKSGFYYATASGEATRLGDDVQYPNGIILSPDEKTLYVLPYASPELMAYPITKPGQIGEGRIHCDIASKASGSKKGGDGLTVDENGNLFLTAPASKAIQVVDPSGNTLGLIPLPRTPTNCTFGGADMKTLYITVGRQVLAAQMDVVGHRFLGAAP